jgi:hypothetical protein
MRAMRVVRVCRHRLLDLRSGRRELPILGQRHGVIGREPKIIAVVRGQTVDHLRDLALLSDTAGAADHSVGVRGYGNNQGVTRPCREMRVQGGDCRFCSAREYKIEKPDVAGFAFGQTGRKVLRRRQRCLRCRDVALPHQYLRLAPVGQGKIRVRCNGPVISLGRAGIECQCQIGGLNVVIPRRSRRGG